MIPLNNHDLEAQVTVTNPDGSIFDQSVWTNYYSAMEAAILCADLSRDKIITVQIRVES